MSNEVQLGFNQMLWAVSDPNWGSPVVIPETIRADQMAAEDAFLRMAEHGLYTGASSFPYPDGTRGKMENARKQGYKLVQIRITPEAINVIG